MGSAVESLSGRTALITGGSRGIGREAALSLAAAGCNVVVNYLNAEAEANAVAEEIRGKGGRALAVQVDVSNPDEVSRLVRSAQQEFGSIDILVNNAGILFKKP